MTRKSYALLFALLLWPLRPATAQDIPLQAEQAWIRAAPPGMPMLAGYARLTNRGPDELRLVSVSGDEFGAIELHRTRTEDGISRMRPVPVLEIPAGRTVVLEPGGLHLMLMRPVRSLDEGDRLILELGFEDGRKLPVEFIVARAAPES